MRGELSWNCDDSISGYRKKQVNHCSSWSFKYTWLTYEERVSATSRLFHSKAAHRRIYGAGMSLDLKTALLKSISSRSKHTHTHTVSQILTVRLEFVSLWHSVAVEVPQQNNYVAPDREAANEEHCAEEDRRVPPTEEPPPRRMARSVHSRVLLISGQEAFVFVHCGRRSTRHRFWVW